MANQCSTATAVVPLAAVSRHLATFFGKFWAAAIFWTIFGIFSEVLPMGITLKLPNSNRRLASDNEDGNGDCRKNVKEAGVRFRLSNPPGGGDW